MNRGYLNTLNSGAVPALLAAILFGVSPVFTKMIVGEMSPVFLAGLLYLGSGIGLILYSLARKQNIILELRRLPRSKFWKLTGAILSGGMVAPIFLVYGIKLANAFQVSLLLNIETVMTTLIAWLVFKEYIGKRVWIGKALLLIGAVLVVIPMQGNAISTSFTLRSSYPALFVLAACFFWGIDNNLTRDVDELSPSVLAGVKGLSAGLLNVALAVIIGFGSMKMGQVAGALVIGIFSYGLSLMFFVKALRLIGASRTSTYFASGPFFGMLLSILILHERPAREQWISAVFMLAGMWILYRENHDHEHTHEQMTHRHLHTHDAHHQHSHDGSEGPEPHEHEHVHDPFTHSHKHLPDLHHRHRH